jgi:hypothetical protein
MVAIGGVVRRHPDSVIDYHAAHGDLEVPVTHRTADGIGLSEWQGTQRDAGRAGKRQALRRLGRPSRIGRRGGCPPIFRHPAPNPPMQADPLAAQVADLLPALADGLGAPAFRERDALGPAGRVSHGFLPHGLAEQVPQVPAVPALDGVRQRRADGLAVGANMKGRPPEGRSTYGQASRRNLALGGQLDWHRTTKRITSYATEFPFRSRLSTFG